MQISHFFFMLGNEGASNLLKKIGIWRCCGWSKTKFSWKYKIALYTKKKKESAAQLIRNEFQKTLVSNATFAIAEVALCLPVYNVR